MSEGCQGHDISIAIRCLWHDSVAMSYFLPSYLQKRILRYALSQIELLDTDALDLDKLAIGWGRQSTVELRDVGIHSTVGEYIPPV